MGEGAGATSASAPRPRAAEATFLWKVKPSEDFVSGTFYLDGSALDGPSVELMRCEWSFVAVDADGTVLASAYGAPPRGWTTSEAPKRGRYCRRLPRPSLEAVRLYRIAR